MSNPYITLNLRYARERLGYTRVVAAGICGVSVDEFLRAELCRDERDAATAEIYIGKLLKQAEASKALWQKMTKEKPIPKQRRKMEFKVGTEYVFKKLNLREFDEPIPFIFTGYTQGANGVILHKFKHTAAGYTETFTYFQLQNFEILRV